MFATKILFRSRTLQFLGLSLLLFAFLPHPTWAQDAWKWIAYGDTRTNDDDHRAVLQAIMDNTPDYKFIINVGDVVANGTEISDWDIWQAACDDVLGGTGQDQVPPKYMSCPGNHDKCDDPVGLTNWNTYLPGQAQQFGNDGKYFVLDYENARIIILDSDASPMTGEQYDMMVDAIENNPKTWLFTVWHHPIFQFGSRDYRDDIHDTWGVPLYENGCDIMFMGHDHFYVRTKKLELNGDKNPPLDPDRGTVQVVTGNGGAPLYAVNPNNDGNGYMVEMYVKEHGYTELTVDGDTLYLRHILKDGTVFDETYYTPNPKPTTDELIAGIVTETHTFDSISIRAPFSGDANENGSAGLMHKLSADTAWVDDGSMTRGLTEFSATITDLNDDTDYDIKVTYVDPDGVIGSNPQIVAVHTLSTKTTTGQLCETHTYNSINVTATYSGDADSDGSASLEYKLSSEVNWTGFGMMTKVDSAYFATVTELLSDTDYDIRVIYNDPDGVNGTNPLILSNIHTTAIVTHTGVLQEMHSHSTITATATYTNDGNENGSATLEHKKSTDATWTYDGTMTKNSLLLNYTKRITNLEWDTDYDIRVTYQDPDGVYGTNPLILENIHTSPTPVLCQHVGPISVDGFTEDWAGVSPSDDDVGYIDATVGEYIWKDARDDDQGDGGDAPLASDNPSSYTYPSGSQFLGTEADIEQFRIAYDDTNIYFLVDLGDSIPHNWMPFVVILIDKDGATNGANSIDYGTYYHTYAKVDGISHKWDYQIICTREGGDFRQKAVDAEGDDLSAFTLMAQNLEKNVYEVSVSLGVLGNPVGETWHFAVLACLGEHGGSDGGKIRNVNYSASSGNGGGGLNGVTDSNIYDLIGASGASQYADLNNYSDVFQTVISNSWVSVEFSPTTSIEESTQPRETLLKIFALLQNSPNPFGDFTIINYQLPTAGHITLKIFNNAGQLIRTLINEKQEAGYYSIDWDAKDNYGKDVPSGVYIYNLKMSGFVQARKMLLIR